MRGYIFETKSDRYAPRNLPVDYVMKEEAQSTTNVLPITIKIKSTDERMGFKSARV
jgi:hypothetical protein